MFHSPISANDLHNGHEEASTQVRVDLNSGGRGCSNGWPESPEMDESKEPRLVLEDSARGQQAIMQRDAEDSKTVHVESVCNGLREASLETDNIDSLIHTAAVHGAETPLKTSYTNESPEQGRCLYLETVALEHCSSSLVSGCTNEDYFRSYLCQGGTMMEYEPRETVSSDRYKYACKPDDKNRSGGTVAYARASSEQHGTQISGNKDPRSETQSVYSSIKWCDFQDFGDSSQHVQGAQAGAHATGIPISCRDPRQLLSHSKGVSEAHFASDLPQDQTASMSARSSSHVCDTNPAFQHQRPVHSNSTSCVEASRESSSALNACEGDLMANGTGLYQPKIQGLCSEQEAMGDCKDAAPGRQGGVPVEVLGQHPQQLDSSLVSEVQEGSSEQHKTLCSGAVGHYLRDVPCPASIESWLHKKFDGDLGQSPRMCASKSLTKSFSPRNLNPTTPRLVAETASHASSTPLTPVLGDSTAVWGMGEAVTPVNQVKLRRESLTPPLAPERCVGRLLCEEGSSQLSPFESPRPLILPSTSEHSTPTCEELADARAAGSVDWIRVQTSLDLDIYDRGSSCILEPDPHEALVDPPKLINFEM